MKIFLLLSVALVFAQPITAQAARDPSTMTPEEIATERADIERQRAQLRTREIHLEIAVLQAELRTLGSAAETTPVPAVVVLPASPQSGATRRAIPILEAQETTEESETAPTPETSTEDRSGDLPETIPEPEEEQNSEGSDNSGGFSLSDFDLGAGIALTHNLSGTRISDYNLERLSDGSLFVQISESQEQSIRFVGETHYLFEDISFFDNFSTNATQGNSNRHNGAANRFGLRNFAGAASDFAVCGLFSLKFDEDSSHRRGCGPFIVGFASDNSLIEEFGIGHMVSFGPVTNNSNEDDEEEKRAFNFGYGVMFDPDSETLDTTLFQPGTMLIRPEYADLVESENLNVVTKEETLGFFFMFSANF